MREIGGFIEFEHYHGEMLHEGSLALNCGRNALAYLIAAKGIERIKLPYFICDSVTEVCERRSVKTEYYHIGPDLLPEDGIVLAEDEWLYLVNYYGQLSNEKIQTYMDKYHRIIVDQAQSYFQMPVEGVDTLYTCRKYFGVPDGAFLYTDTFMEKELPVDESFERMRFLLGRFERTAGEFYPGYAENNKTFSGEPVKIMSKLTDNLLRAIDYDFIRRRRCENFNYLNEQLERFNKLTLKPADFMYPLMIENGKEIRRKLQEQKLYIPTLWPSVFEIAEDDSQEYQMAENILPLPIDQRYGIDDMEYMMKLLEDHL